MRVTESLFCVARLTTRASRSKRSHVTADNKTLPNAHENTQLTVKAPCLRALPAPMSPSWQAGDVEQVQSLAKDVAVRDARRRADRPLPGPTDVETAVAVLGDGNEPQEWWSAFEDGYG